jgi:diaminopimelate decarboxylase
MDFVEWQKVNFEKFQCLDFLGFHIFQWGNILETDRLQEIWTQIGLACQKYAENLKIPLKILDLGGGLGIAYHSTNSKTPSIQWSRIADILKTLKSRFSLNEIWMELGRFAVGSCGVYVTEVVDRKTVRGRKLLVTQGGIQHMARPALVRQSFPCTLLRVSDSPLTEYQVHGPLCTSLDQLGHFTLPSDIEVGDRLIFTQTGAYGFTESMPYFLCHEGAAEGIILNQKIEVVRTAMSPEAWLR